MLVIPAIDLRGGRCVRLHDGTYHEEQDYFLDPVRMAKLWRVMNAKSLHLADLGDEHASNRSIIGQIAAALDIPVQVGGGLRSLDDVEEVLSLGAYRAVLGRWAEEGDTVSEALRGFGASRIIVAVQADEPGRAADLEARGVRRVVATDVATTDGPDLTALRALAEPLSRARVTVAGGVGGYPDLLALQTLTSLGVDSVIVGQALYENRFPCQQFWCWHRKEDIDLDRFSTARLALRGQ